MIAGDRTETASDRTTLWCLTGRLLETLRIPDLYLVKCPYESFSYREESWHVALPVSVECVERSR